MDENDDELYDDEDYEVSANGDRQTINSESECGSIVFGEESEDEEAEMEGEVSVHMHHRDSVAAIRGEMRSQEKAKSRGSIHKTSNARKDSGMEISQNEQSDGNL